MNKIILQIRRVRECGKYLLFFFQAIFSRLIRHAEPPKKLKLEKNNYRICLFISAFTKWILNTWTWYMFQLSKQIWVIMASGTPTDYGSLITFWWLPINENHQNNVDFVLVSFATWTDFHRLFIFSRYFCIFMIVHFQNRTSP